MNNQSGNLKYPKHYKYRAPQINLPYKQTDPSIFYFYSLRDDDHHPTKTASCNVCGKEFEVIPGSNVYSSYTVSLKFHLQLHKEQWLDYLDCLKTKMAPDTKTKFEHFLRMEQRVCIPEFIADKKSQEIREHEYFVKKNVVGKPYMERDHFYLKNRKSNLYGAVTDGENCVLLEYIYKFTNRNVSLIELLGDKYQSANLQKKYKRYKCLTENIGNIVLDLERLFCENMCFFDPVNYDQCPYEHKGDIAIFSDTKYQQRFPQLIEELEKYPEFIVHKTFDHNLLKQVKRVENDNHALVEMNRLLRIILALVHIKKEIIGEKIANIVRDGTGEDKLIKPSLVLQRWGPWYQDPDDDKDVWICRDFEQSMFSTYQHVNDEDCPGFGAAEKLYTVPFCGEHGKVYYPCNVGGCARGCECEVCNMWAGDEVVNCPDHHPDHPRMYNSKEDIVIHRRIYFEPTHKWPRFERPISPKHGPSELKLAGMKRKCIVCRQVVRDHLENHHSVKLHEEFCEICAHLQLLSGNSFALTCYICMKKFESKYRLQDHLNVHSTHNKYNCFECNQKFTTSFTYERHISENHTEVKVFECNFCEQKFSLERNLHRHITNSHEMGENPFKCNLCDKTFQRNDTLLKHERVIHNINKQRLILKGVNDINENFKCSQCEKVFKLKDKLKRHSETVHSQELDQYLCEICKKIFNRKDNLKKHQKTHSR